MGDYYNSEYNQGNWIQPYQDDSSSAYQNNDQNYSFTPVTLSWIVNARAPEKLSKMEKLQDKIFGPPDEDTEDYKMILNNGKVKDIFSLN
ncbi:hypothetical protein BpHYR1_023620 [Brachionus plicatilis]|uniref:Uncharacterized protein n=1 Tax=Brachionus plicatilis TaxID=10195 RepID=A0A3M7PMB7_BRAPC|nr:hypothetical protein BpHYR1_023620 [Brachionus plicatilis]